MTSLDREADFVGDVVVVGVLMDLGVSSHQLDDATRGFSFRADAPLDMRMDPTTGETAAEYLVTGRRARPRATAARERGESLRGIDRQVDRRTSASHDLRTESKRSSAPSHGGRRRRGHVATRVFQALRIAVNAEEDELDARARAPLSTSLSVGGLVAVISYHSGEDRVVKAFLAEQQSGGCTCPPELGCVCGAVPRVQVFKASAQLAEREEIAGIPAPARPGCALRARSRP